MERVAVITGASQGLGRALATALAGSFRGAAEQPAVGAGATGITRFTKLLRLGRK